MIELLLSAIIASKSAFLTDSVSYSVSPKVYVIGQTLKQSRILRTEKDIIKDMIVRSAKRDGINPDTALKVAEAESHFRPQAYNNEPHKGCRGSYGVFQIACIHSDTPRELMNPVANINAAMRLQKRYGWKIWGVCVDKVNCGEP